MRLAEVYGVELESILYGQQENRRVTCFRRAAWGIFITLTLLILARSALLCGNNLFFPIATGERIYTRWQYIEYFLQNAIQVIQPDLGTCGGITEVKKVCDMALTFDVGVQIHACGSPLSTAAALQVEAAIPNFVIHEHHIYARTPQNRALCIHDYQPVNGKFEVPDLPGIGNELSEYAFQHCDMVSIQ